MIVVLYEERLKNSECNEGEEEDLAPIINPLESVQEEESAKQIKKTKRVNKERAKPQQVKRKRTVEENNEEEEYNFSDDEEENDDKDNDNGIPAEQQVSYFPKSMRTRRGNTRTSFDNHFIPTHLLYEDDELSDQERKNTSDNSEDEDYQN